MFVGVLAATVIIQMCMVELSGKTAKCYPLNWQQNLWACLFGFIELPFGWILKRMPLGAFQCIAIDETAKGDDAKPSIKDRMKSGSSYSKNLKSKPLSASGSKMMAQMANGAKVRGGILEGFKDQEMKKLGQIEYEEGQMQDKMIES